MEVKSDLAYELAIAAASGASWNAELISSYNDALKALKDYWPGIRMRLLRRLVMEGHRFLVRIIISAEIKIT